jgi:T-complex protein 1 subunit zeta
LTKINLKLTLIHNFFQDAVRDGLRAVKNALEDGCVVPGGGAFEVAVHVALKKAMEELKGRERLGMQAYADGMLVIPKVLAVNAGILSILALNHLVNLPVL